MRRWICILGLLGATGMVSAMGCGISSEADEPGEPVGEAGMALSLDECNRACRNGQQAMEQFCYGLPPDPRLRMSCWAVAKLGLAACLGWCYSHFGN
jgi:hypothetical protein